MAPRSSVDTAVRSISIVVPIYNEEQNIKPLHAAISTAMAGIPLDYEIICVNDGSTDGSEHELAELAAQDSKVRVVNFRRNCGQTAALMAGFDFARNDIVVPMDADLQNDPTDIPRLLEKIDEGYTVVSGWRRNRKDAALRRNLPSRIANWLISWISGVHLHDYGCTLKAYRKDVLANLHLYGEMHRFVPVYASWHGGKVTEVEVTHHPRKWGHSKYGLERIFKVLLDIIVIKFLGDFQTKPIYVFGFFGMACFLGSFLIGLYTVYLRVFEGTSFIQTPLPLLVVMVFLIGVLSIFLGLLAELLIRVYFESQGKPVYFIRDTLNIDRDDV